MLSKITSQNVCKLHRINLTRKVEVETEVEFISFLTNVQKL